MGAFEQQGRGLGHQSLVSNESINQLALFQLGLDDPTLHSFRYRGVTSATLVPGTRMEKGPRCQRPLCLHVSQQAFSRTFSNVKSSQRV